MQGFFAALAGAAVLHLLAALSQAPLARAGWCWSLIGNIGSPYGCNSPNAIGHAACNVEEDCCAGYKCHLSNQCTRGADHDDPDGPLFENTRPAMTAANESCEGQDFGGFATTTTARGDLGGIEPTPAPAPGTTGGGPTPAPAPGPTGAPGPTPAPPTTSTVQSTLAATTSEEVQSSSSSTNTTTPDTVLVVGSAHKFSVRLAVLAALSLRTTLLWSQ
mmetsp:Transcript_27272/g.62826  ORF Transcript_27272/g.62826 Transcript_27272/m.62826 type:complete len:218 (-) Transcript_27272:22-675(-)